MAGDTNSCVKCGSRMTTGFIADRTDLVYYPATWVDGDPVYKSVFGIEASNLDVKPGEERTVFGLRCTGCGYLELYAS